MTDLRDPPDATVGEPMGVAEASPLKSEDPGDGSSDGLHRMSRRFGERLRNARQARPSFLTLLK